MNTIKEIRDYPRRWPSIPATVASTVSLSEKVRARRWWVLTRLCVVDVATGRGNSASNSVRKFLRNRWPLSPNTHMLTQASRGSTAEKSKQRHKRPSQRERATTLTMWAKVPTLPKAHAPTLHKRADTPDRTALTLNCSQVTSASASTTAKRVTSAKCVSLECGHLLQTETRRRELPAPPTPAPAPFPEQRSPSVNEQYDSALQFAFVRKSHGTSVSEPA
jgi:hypothetical protein